MKGLLVKDFMLIYKIGKVYLIFIAVMLLGGAAFSNISFLSYYAVVFFSILGPNTIAYDERDRWDKFALTLPITKSQYVSSKYLLSFILTSGAALMCAVVFILHDGFSVNCFLSVLPSFALGLFYPAVSLPVMLRFGYAKGKIPIIFLAGIIGGLSVLLSKTKILMPQLSEFNYLFLILFAVITMVFVLSWAIAVKLFKNREF